jgi:hypothetical protein
VCKTVSQPDKGTGVVSSIVAGCGMYTLFWPLTGLINLRFRYCTRSILSSMKCGRLADLSQFGIDDVAQEYWSLQALSWCLYQAPLSCPLAVVPLLKDINVYVTLLLNAETNPQYGYGLIMDLVCLWNRILKISEVSLYSAAYNGSHVIYIMLKNPDPVDSFILHVMRWDLCWR